MPDPLTRPPAGLRAALRSATAEDHARLDAVFGTFDLAEPDGYRRFLRAHARALAPIEAAIARAPDTGEWHPRAPLLAADLAALGEPSPAPMPLDPPDGARLWGMRYVVEGSRLGGALLARQVGAGLPAAYLSAHHGKGEWRGFLATLDEAVEAGGSTAHDEAIEGAREAFALFARSAAHGRTSDGER